MAIEHSTIVDVLNNKMVELMQNSIEQQKEQVDHPLHYLDEGGGILVNVLSIFGM